jgi:cellulose biosynthesis protein BcsQ
VTGLKRRAHNHPGIFKAVPIIAVLHPKGGVGRSTSVWQLGAEFALRGLPVRIEDLDQGAHLTRVFKAHPLGLDNLTLGSTGPADDVVLLDTAPEANHGRAMEYLTRADFALVPVKGPEEVSVQALPMLMSWITQANHARLLGFVPTMFKPRRASCRHWMDELGRLAERYQTRVFAPIPDQASIADMSLRGHPYATLAQDVLHAIS